MLDVERDRDIEGKEKRGGALRFYFKKWFGILGNVSICFFVELEQVHTICISLQFSAVHTRNHWLKSLTVSTALILYQLLLNWLFLHIFFLSVFLTPLKIWWLGLRLKFRFNLKHTNANITLVCDV